MRDARTHPRSHAARAGVLCSPLVGTGPVTDARLSADSGLCVRCGAQAAQAPPYRRPRARRPREGLYRPLRRVSQARYPTWARAPPLSPDSESYFRYTKQYAQIRIPRGRDAETTVSPRFRPGDRYKVERPVGGYTGPRQGAYSRRERLAALKPGLTGYLGRSNLG